MIVPFWSTHHGQSRNTCNMMCIAITSVLEYKTKAIMTQTHFSHNNLEGPFLGYIEQRMQDDILGEFGLAALFKSFKSEPITKNIIEECSANIDKNLNLLPGNYIGSWDLFSYEMKELLPTVLSKIDGFYDYLFVDTPSGSNDIAKLVIELSDVIVVCLNQNPGVINGFFQNFDFWKNKKVFYLIGDYDCTAKYNYKHILAKNKEIKYENSAVIPYNTDFRDSLNDRSTVDFFRENINAGLDKSDKNYQFLSEVEQATKKLFSNIAKWRKL